MPRRTWLVSVSIIGHVGLGVGLWVSGMWKLERLESDRRLANIGVMTPSLASGGSPDLPEVKFQKKQPKVEKKIAKNVQWDKRVVKEESKLESKVPGGGGDGPEGPGKEVGPVGPPGDTLCMAPPCEPPKQPEVKLPDPVVKKPPIVPPHILKALRTDGDTQIKPSRNVQNQILSDGLTGVTAAVKLCIDTSGRVSSVTLIASTKYPEYDQQLMDGARRWSYRPYLVNGVPTPACGPVNFVYGIK
jgi:TonB family protein